LGLRARWLFQKGDHAGARATYERAIALDPNDARARYDFGTLLMTLGEQESARAQFRAVDDLRPGDPQAQVGLAVIALDEGQAAEAARLLEGVLQHRPEFALARSNLAVAYERLGDWKRALEAYLRLNAAGALDPDLACAAAWILATGPDESLCDGAKAVELARFAAARQVRNAPEVLAAANARAGDFEQALKIQQQLVERTSEPKAKREYSQRLELFRAQEPYTRPR
jgi:tetratricopeptide (TPR) repeat protein